MALEPESSCAFPACPSQYRVDKLDCVHRAFNETNGTNYMDGWVYQPETGGLGPRIAVLWVFTTYCIGEHGLDCLATVAKLQPAACPVLSACTHFTHDATITTAAAAVAGLHEMLLQSEHRTLDPEEADYFYMPVGWRQGQTGGGGSGVWRAVGWGCRTLGPEKR